MKINPNGRPVELGYMAVCEGLKNDIGSDACMPDAVKSRANDLLSKLRDMLEPYSA